MNHPRALIAEDEEPQRLKLWPELHIVSQCEDGLAALEALTSLQPEVAFLDIRMPGLTGYVRVATLEDEVQIRTPLRELLASLDPEAFWRIHRSVIVRAAAIHRIELDAERRLQLRVKGRTDVLPVSSAFQYRFKPM